jgi:hypothetical protein
MHGRLLGLVALSILAAALAHYATRVRAVRVPKRPRVHQTLAGMAVLLAIAAFASGPGLLGGLAAGLAAAAGALFLVLTTISGLPAVRPAVAVGAPAPDFTAPDSEGRAVSLSALRGQRILLKFFRGHW